MPVAITGKLQMRLCACKNPDLDTAQHCNLNARNHEASLDTQLPLFDSQTPPPSAA